MKPLLFACSLLLFTIPQSTEATEPTYEWTDYTTITEIETAIGGWAWFHLASGPVDCGAGKPTNLQLTTSGVASAVSSGRDKIYTTLLSAMFAGKQVSFRFGRHANASNAWCVIERVSVKP